MRNAYAEASNFMPRRYAHIVGWGMAVPETVMTNADISKFVETDDEWIQSRTGIRQRYIANDRETTTTLAHEAAQHALETADILPTDLDLIIVATSTPVNVFPSTANMLQDWLGANRAGAFDLSAACAGFVYALNMAADSIRAGSAETVLVVGAETMSRVMDWQDRSTCILFGDGAGAVVLQASEMRGGVLSTVLRSDGAGDHLLGLPTRNNPDLNGHRVNKLHMVGSEVFKFATRVVNESIREAAEDARIEVDDISLVVPHQANMRILQTAARKLDIPIEKFVSNVEHYGNTSAASIPIALCEAVSQGRLLPGQHVAFCGFGGGLSWAAMIIEWTGTVAEASRINRERRRLTYTFARARSVWRRVSSRMRRFVSNLS